MKIESALMSVFVLYLKFFFVYLAYKFSVFIAATERSCENPPIRERVKFYLYGLGVCIFVFLFASHSAVIPSEDDPHPIGKVNYTLGIIAFLILAIPIAIGLTGGFETSQEEAPEWKRTSRNNTSYNGDF